LEHLVTPQGIQPLPNYIEAVKKWELPKTKTDARVFLGKIGYYRRFIKDFSAIAAPWTDVTGKDTQENEKKLLEQTDNMRTSFE
jgi:hypothetical protein